MFRIFGHYTGRLSVQAEAYGRGNELRLSTYEYVRTYRTISQLDRYPVLRRRCTVHLVKVKELQVLKGVL